MRIDLDRVFKALDGSDLKAGAESLTLGRVAVESLEANGPFNVGLSEATKVALDALAEKIFPGGVQDLSIDEVKLIKDRVVMLGSPRIARQVSKLLDPVPGEP